MPGKPGPCGASLSGAIPDTVPDQQKNRLECGSPFGWLTLFLFTSPARRDSPERMWGFSEEAA